MFRSTFAMAAGALALLLAASGSAAETTRSGAVDPAVVGNPPLTCGDTSTDIHTYPNRGITLPTPVLPASEIHPAVDFSAADIPTLRRRARGAAADPHGLYARNWARIESDVKNGTTGGVSADDINSRKAKAYGFAYVITGDTGDLNTAVEAMKAAFTGFDTDDQYIAAQVTNYAQAYDYTAGHLSSADDAAARAAIKRGAQWLADWLSNRIPGDLNPRPHNHRSKVAEALGLWSLVFAADPDAGPWLRLSADQLNSVFQYMFTRDGVYLDGYAYYWIFQLFHALPYFYAARDIGGADPFPALRPVFEWMVRDSTPKGWLPNVEDSWIKLPWTAVVAEPYRRTGTSLSDSAPLGQVLQWRFFNSDWTATRYPEDWTGGRNQAYLWPDELAHIDERIPETRPDSSGFDFYGQGGNTTVMRSDWRYGDAGTRWLMFYGAPQSNNHDHCDVMQVLLDAENTVMLNDDGYGPARFSGRNAWKGTAQHNVITMDGAGSNDVFANTVDLDGALTGYAEKLAYYDQTQPGVAGTKWWRRGVLFPGRDYAVISDTLHSPADQTWDSYLHARGTLTRDGERATWTTPSSVFGASARLYTFTLPVGAATTVESGQDNLFGTATAPPDTETNTYLRRTQRGTDGQYLTLAVPRPLSAAAPVFTDLSAGRVLAATVGYDGNTDTTLEQPSSSPAEAGALTTDGTLAWTRESGGRLRGWQIAHGTRLGYAGTSWMTASTPLSATADLAGQRIDLQAAGAYTLDVAGVHPAATFNGTQVKAAVHDGRTTYRLIGSGRLILTPAGTTD